MFQITNGCVACHNCASECPMQAIDYIGTKYEIDQDKCVECGLCAKVCHTASIIDTTATDDVPKHDRIVMDADVVVCGTGTGLIAAVKAAMDGKKVVVLEKSKRLGGNTDYAHAYFPVFTKWHEKAGLPDVREEAIQHYLNVTNHILAPDVVRTAVYGCGDFFDWLCEFGTCEEVYELSKRGEVDAVGPIYGLGIIFFPNRIRDNLNCRDDAIGPGWSGTYIKYTMLEAIEKQGLDVNIYLEHRAKHLLVDETGSVTGIVAEGPGGETQVNAPVVILATGGYGRSEEKLREFIPEFFDDKVPYHCFSVPTNTGDAIDMLRELGVEPDPNRMSASMFGPKHHPFNNTLADIALEPEMLQINLDGNRWVDETLHLHGMSPYISAQPKAISWSIQSLDNIEMIANRFLANPAYASKINFFEMWKQELDEESLLDTPVKKADTLEELERLCGMPTNSLVKTVERYNAFCAEGTDLDYGKSADKMVPVSDHGPYYAIYGQRFSDQASGGLMVDGQCRVLRNDGSAIPGLYGVGDATSAMHIRYASAVISELTWAVASAYTSAIEAVNYLGKEGADAKC